MILKQRKCDFCNLHLSSHPKGELWLCPKCNGILRGLIFPSYNYLMTLIGET